MSSIETTWLISTASVSYSVTDGVGCFQPRGIITSNTAREFFASVTCWAHHHQLNAYLLRFDEVTLLASELDVLTAAMEHAEPMGRPKVPAAIYTGADTLPQFVRHSVLMNEQGFCRRAFSELAPAMAWLQRMALIHLAWVEAEQASAVGAAPAAAPACPASPARPAVRRRPVRAPLRQD